jgi:hypothetical protein
MLVREEQVEEGSSRTRRGNYNYLLFKAESPHPPLGLTCFDQWKGGSMARKLLGLIFGCSGVKALVALRVPLDANVSNDDVTEL